jgi:phage shock protein PspC (stress-responsive transcriptional regulator)
MNEHTQHPDEGPAAAGKDSAGKDSAGADSAGAAAAGKDTAGKDSAGRADDRTAGSAGPSAPVPGDTAQPPAGEPGTPFTAAPPPLYPSGEPGPGPTPPPYYGTLPPYAPGPPFAAAPPSAAAQPQNFFDWIRSHGIYRGRDRWIGGVASGIAQRLGIDPLIVRGVLMVLTVFAGVGVLLYGIAWALLPEPDGRIHVQEAAAGRWTAGMTGALITTVIGLPSLGAGVWGWDRYGFGGFIWTMFWVGGAIYLVYYLTQRNKTQDGSPAVTSRPQPGGPDNPANAANPSDTVHAASVAGRSYEATPYGAPYYGAAPLDASYGGAAARPPGGGYRPVPGGSPAPPAKARHLGPGSPAVAVTAGVALLVGGGMKALDAANVIDLGSSSNAIVWASGAAVLGLGILISGLRGRTSGILGFFAVVALIFGGIFSAVPNGDRFRLQNADWSPASMEQARNGFDITGGTGTVDLTRLPLNPPLGADVAVPIHATASNLTVVIPSSVPVQIQADMTMGNLHEAGQDHGGMTKQQSDYNTGKPGARLIVKIDGTLSNVTIQEGN